MTELTFNLNGENITLYSCNTVVVGSGAAGFNAANRLYEEGVTDVVMVTENVLLGTSRNTGSDKQTYYKLTLSGGEPDSVEDMAKTLFDGGCVDGDIAMCEAAVSAQAFYNLVGLGVPFPRNRNGEFVGYKTDHDPRTRATSVGPYTSKIMTEQLEKAVVGKGIEVFNGFLVIKILVSDNTAYGLVCLDLKAGCLVCFCCANIVYATGGPGGIYSKSVYPFGHYGSSGIAFEAGVMGKNLTEWQYGLASLHPRWNVSGTYMQVLPRFVSTDQSGKGECEFLSKFFNDKNEMLNLVFLKGYQWPFDIKKIKSGSSIIDILVYIECSKGRRVFLDFRSNPALQKIDYSQLSPEVFAYLNSAKACFGTPYDRLCHMNLPAVDFYRDKGVDLKEQMLEIALSAQHNNGGLSIDNRWQTNIRGFYAVGEVAASHGIYRPGGSALNAGQVGGIRAAEHIAYSANSKTMLPQEYIKSATDELQKLLTTMQKIVADKQGNVKELLATTTEEMSRVGGAIRNIQDIKSQIATIKPLIDNFDDRVKISAKNELGLAFRLRDILMSQYVYLCSMQDYVSSGAKSRGSALYSDTNGELPYKNLPEMFRFSEDDGGGNAVVQQVIYSDKDCEFSRREVRPLPCDDNFFENVWRGYRKNKNML